MSKKKNNRKIKKQGGFTIIEMLIVVLIFALLSVAIATTTRQIIIANTRLRSIQVAQSQGQEAIQFLTKQIRMSDYAGAPCNPCGNIQLDWRKPDAGGGYVTQAVNIDAATVSSFFQGSSVQNFGIFAEGITGNNRVTIVWELVVGNPGNDVTIPMQITASLRSFNVN